MADDPSAQSDDQLGLSLSNWCGCLKPLTETVSKLSHAFHFRSSAGALGWSVGYVEIGVRNSVTGNRPALVAKCLAIERLASFRLNAVTRLMRSTACEPETVAIAIEMSRGALVETLLDRGFAVFSINPKQVDRFRDRFTVAGAKDDTRDALVSASSLRTDRRSFKLVEIDSPEIIRLRELSRFEDELKAELRRTMNRLWQQLHLYYPQALKLSPAADDLFI